MIGGDVDELGGNNGGEVAGESKVDTTGGLVPMGVLAFAESSPGTGVEVIARKLHEAPSKP